MTDKPTDEDINDSNTPEPIVEEEAEIQEIDPMLEGLEEAEAEIKAEEEESKAKAGGENDPSDPPKGEDGELEPKAEAEPETKPEDVKAKGLTVPKPRFDEVLSERDLLRDQVGYLQGRADTLEAGLKPQPTEAEANPEQKPGEGDQEGSKVDEIDTAIQTAEAKKLELAEKYDEGEISIVDMKKAEIAIDQDIRGLSKQRLEQTSERLANESKAHTDAAVSASQVQDQINTEALAIQGNHPNVATIDATPAHIRDGIWNQISDQAATNLAQRGINVNDGSPHTKMALIREKAALTDTYTPESLAAFLPEGFKAPSTQQKADGQNTEGEGKISETAINRQKKLDLAENQAPDIAGMGNGADKTELSDEDIENMTEDEMADLMQKSPQLVQRILDKP